MMNEYEVTFTFGIIADCFEDAAQKAFDAVQSTDTLPYAAVRKCNDDHVAQGEEVLVDLEAHCIL